MPAGRAQSTNDFETARKLYQDGQWQEALTAFQKCETTHPFSATVPDAINYEGWCWLNLHRFEDAATAFARVLRDYPTAPVAAEATLKKAECHRALKQFDQAEQLYREFPTKYPQHALIAQAMVGEAATRFDSHDYAAAETAVRTLLGRFPNQLDALFLLGQVLTKEERYEDADKVYHDLLDRHPNDRVAEQAGFSLIQSLAQRGQLEQASAEIETYKKRYPKSGLIESAMLIQAEALFGQQNYKEALPLYEQTLLGAKDPQAAETIQFRIASCQFNVEQFDKARDGFAGVVEKYPQGKLAPDALFHLGQTYSEIARRTNDPKIAQPHPVEATKAYDKAVASFQEFVQKWPGNSLVPEALYQIASAHADERKFPEMVESLRQYAKRYPNHVHVADALYTIGTQLEAQKKPDEAMAAYRDLIVRAATNRPLADPWRDPVIAAQLRIAALLESASALAECENFLTQFAGDPTAARTMVSQIAALYRKDKKLDAGYAKLDQLAQQYQANSAVRVVCATSTIELALADKDFGRATAAAAKLLTDPEREKLPAASYIALGNTFLKTGQFQPARENFEKILALYPNDSRLLPAGQLGLGQALFGLGQFDAAETALRKATGVDADLALAKIDEAKGKLKEAVDLYNRVMQNGRGEISSEAAYRLGNFFFNQTDPAKSKDNKKTALAYYARLLFATGPMAEEAAYRAGECHEALGNLPQACATFQAYVKRFPTGQFGDGAKSKIARLCAPPPS